MDDARYYECTPFSVSHVQSAGTRNYETTIVFSGLRNAEQRVFPPTAADAASPLRVINSHEKGQGEYLQFKATLQFPVSESAKASAERGNYVPILRLGAAFAFREMMAVATGAPRGWKVSQETRTGPSLLGSIFGFLRG